MAHNTDAARAVGASEARAPCTVLVVDDDPTIQELVSMALEDDGYAVRTATNEETPAQARVHQPNLILLDQMMPGMDGIAVSHRLKADPLTAEIPIVTMSANQPLAPIQRAMHAVDCLGKPFTLAALYQTVARWCRRR